MLVTPLQMALATAAVANEGTLYQPQVVRSVVDDDKNIISDFEPKIIRQDIVDKNYLKTVKRGMRQAVYEGSAWALAELPVEAAGKTGTAQYGNNKKTHAWFTAFAPYDDPQIALAIIVEGGGEGSQIAASVAKEVLDFYFKQ
jgi:penicillin-binding protein 2